MIDERLVRTLVRTQAGARLGASAELPLRKADEGWDCELWRLGDDIAVRLPRRAAAAPLIAGEQSVLPGIAQLLDHVDVRVPVPLFAGAAGSGFPWRWSIVPWIDGSSGLEVTRSERSGWAAPLAHALRALHVEAPSDAPANPFRGRALITRKDAVAERLHTLARDLTPDVRERAAHVWDEGERASEWPGAPVWIHGDLHPGNLIARGRHLAGIVDFGDVTAGDPAYDLAIAWLAFDDVGRCAFRDGVGDYGDPPIWTRARAWAIAVSLLLLTQSDDEPAYRRLGAEGLAQALAG